MININLYQNKNQVTGTKEELFTELTTLIQAFLLSGEFKSSEIVTSVCLGFFYCNKEKDFYNYASKMSNFDYGKLKRLSLIKGLQCYETNFDIEKDDKN